MTPADKMSKARLAGHLVIRPWTHEQEMENFARQEREDAQEVHFCPFCGDMVGNCDCLLDHHWPDMDAEEKAYAKECDRYNRTGKGHERG
jgi:hypothetical protein